MVSMMGLHAAQHISTLLRLLTAYIILEGSIVELEYAAAALLSSSAPYFGLDMPHVYNLIAEGRRW